jgi:hypothetical protein
MLSISNEMGRIRFPHLQSLKVIIILYLTARSFNVLLSVQNWMIKIDKQLIKDSHVMHVFLVWSLYLNFKKSEGKKEKEKRDNNSYKDEKTSEKWKIAKDSGKEYNKNNKSNGG